jgi:hypothetical protein
MTDAHRPQLRSSQDDALDKLCRGQLSKGGVKGLLDHHVRSRLKQQLSLACRGQDECRCILRRQHFGRVRRKGHHDHRTGGSSVSARLGNQRLVPTMNAVEVSNDQRAGLCLRDRKRELLVAGKDRHGIRAEEGTAGRAV